MTACAVVTFPPSPAGDLVATCRCGWSATWTRCGPWPDGLPLRTTDQLAQLAAPAVAAHLRGRRRHLAVVQ